MLRPLPYVDADRLVDIGAIGRGRLRGVAAQDFFSWCDGTRSFDGLAAAFPGVLPQLQADGADGEIVTARVTANLFDVLGVQPAPGRLFRPDADAPGDSGTVVLAHRAWTRWFGAGSSACSRVSDRLAATDDSGRLFCVAAVSGCIR